MPQLSNSKHERFAQEIAQGRSASEAFVLAGYAKNDSNAARLNENERVKARVAELIAERVEINREGINRAVERVQVSVESLLREAEAVRAKALEAGQFAAAISAIKEKGILAGLRVEKREQAHRTAEALSDAELTTIARGGGGEWLQ